MTSSKLFQERYSIAILCERYNYGDQRNYHVGHGAGAGRRLAAPRLRAYGSEILNLYTVIKYTYIYICVEYERKYSPTSGAVGIDIRLPGSAARGETAVKYNIKVYGFMASKTLDDDKEAGGGLDTTSIILRRTVQQVLEYLFNVASGADGQPSWAIGGFKRIVFNLGGLMEKETTKELGKLGKYEGYVRVRWYKRVSLVFLKIMGECQGVRRVESDA